MSTFDDLEASVEDSRPREYCTITHGTVTYRISFADRDLLIAGQVYTAIAADRSEAGVAASGKDTSMVLTLPVDHALVRRYLQQGTPPRRITFTLSRQQADGSTEQVFVGEITSMNVDDDNASAQFRIPSRASQSLLRVVPNVTIGRTCPHMLYDTMCKIPRTLGTTYFSTTAIIVTGREIRVDLGVSLSDPHRQDWAVMGEIYHPSSGERMTVISQSDVDPGVSTLTRLTMQMPIVELKAGDTIEVYAGCDWLIETCDNKFSNRQNFGGFPQLPKSNPFIPGAGSEGL